jgi:hypothetical protein
MHIILTKQVRLTDQSSNPLLFKDYIERNYQKSNKKKIRGSRVKESVRAGHVQLHSRFPEQPVGFFFTSAEREKGRQKESREFFQILIRTHRK